MGTQEEKAEVNKEATDALMLIFAREQDCAKGKARDIALAEERMQDADATIGAQIQAAAEDETDEGLEAALCQSEAEVLYHEQGQLHEALLRSKLDSVQQKASPPIMVEKTADDASRLVLLSFTRFPKEFRGALLASQLAARLNVQGIDLEPPWACTRLVLGHDIHEHQVSEARELWHVVVRAADEDEVHAIRLALDPKTRPRVKNRFLVPVGISLFDVESEWNPISGVWQTSGSVHPGTDWRELAIVNTFLHAPTRASTVPLRAKSAPP